jgi:hypothetical protein
VVLCGIKEDTMAATKAELFDCIRRDSSWEELSVRALACKYGVRRRLVREALTHAEPTPRKTSARRSPQLVLYSAVRDYVSRCREEGRIEEGRGPAKVFVPQQHHPPGRARHGIPLTPP